MRVPDTFEALLIVSFAVLPGAAFIFALERTTGAWGVKAPDRVLRFISLSAILYVLLAPYGYWLFRHYILSHHLINAKPFPWIPYLALLAYLGLLPWLLGSLAGWAINKNNERVGQMFGHQMRPPRAFDYVFHGEPKGFVRMLLNLNGTEPVWVAGAYTTEEETVEEPTEPPAEDAAAEEGGPTDGGESAVSTAEETEKAEEAAPVKRRRRAYVAGYPEDPDIFLPVRLRCDPDTGEFELDDHGNVITEQVGVLVKQSSIAYLEFIDR